MQKPPSDLATAIHLEYMRRLRERRLRAKATDGGSQVPRATEEARARRTTQTLQAWVQSNGSTAVAAQIVGVSRRTAERDLKSLLDRRPMHPSKRALALHEELESEYRRVRFASLKDQLASSGRIDEDPARESNLRLSADTVGPDFKPLAAEEIEQPEDAVIRRVGRAVSFFDEPTAVLPEIEAAIERFGSPTQILRPMKPVERNIRLLLLYKATSYKQADLSEAFGISERQVRRILSSSKDQYPEVAQTGEIIGRQLRSWKAECVLLERSLLGASGSRLPIIDLRSRTLTYLGALPSRRHHAYRGRREQLFADLESSCDKHELGQECRERLRLIISAWANGKKMPAGVPPLPRAAASQIPG
jgi:hypothetical protein